MSTFFHFPLFFLTYILPNFFNWIFTSFVFRKLRSPSFQSSLSPSSSSSFPGSCWNLFRMKVNGWEVQKEWREIKETRGNYGCSYFLFLKVKNRLILYPKRVEIGWHFLLCWLGRLYQKMEESGSKIQLLA